MWKRKRVSLHIRSDNIGALTLFAALKGKGSLTLLAQEFALDVGDGVYMPQVVSHISGVANTLADVLSRKDDPSKQPWSLPTQLAAVPRTFLEKRSQGWWRTKAG